MTDKWGQIYLEIVNGMPKRPPSPPPSANRSPSDLFIKVVVDTAELDKALEKVKDLSDMVDSLQGKINDLNGKQVEAKTVHIKPLGRSEWEDFCWRNNLFILRS